MQNLAFQFYECVMLLTFVSFCSRKRVGGLKLEDLPGRDALQTPGLVIVLFSGKYCLVALLSIRCTVNASSLNYDSRNSV